MQGAQPQLRGPRGRLRGRGAPSWKGQPRAVLLRHSAPGLGPLPQHLLPLSQGLLPAPSPCEGTARLGLAWERPCQRCHAPKPASSPCASTSASVGTRGWGPVQAPLLHVLSGTVPSLQDKAGRWVGAEPSRGGLLPSLVPQAAQLQVRGKEK